MKLLYALVMCLLGSVTTADAASSFVYVAAAAPACDVEPCPPGQLIVFDGATKEVVTAAPLGTARNVPAGMAMSHDGNRLYISLRGADNGASLAIFDTTRHQMGATHALPAGVAGAVAVTRDNNRVFVTGGGKLVVWDVQTAAVSMTQNTSYGALFGHPTLDRIVAASLTQPFPGLPHMTPFLLDEVTGAVLASKDPGFASHVSFSPDGTRFYGTFPATSIHPSNGGRIGIYSTTTLDVLAVLGCKPHCFPDQAYDAPAANRIVSLSRYGTETSIGIVDRTTTDVLGALMAPHVFASGVVTGDHARFWMSSQLQAGGFQPNANALSVVRFEPLALERTIALPSSPLLLAASPSSAGRCSYTVTPSQSSWAREGGTATIALSTACAWAAAPTASWLHVASDSTSGIGNRTITVTVDPFFGGDPSRSATVVIGGQVVQFTQAGFGSQPPFGSFDTPQDGITGVAGDLAIGGWALDDVGVTRVRIFRDGDVPGQQIYIGDATLVDGARPDVQAVFPSAPFASRAGWGYQLLTNMLPNGGDGTFRLHVYADDVDGRTTLLGSRTIGVSNSTSTLPFGTIDTPGQGETVSGTMLNFGWALSANGIAEDGSTIGVYIDNVFVGRPVYNLFRSDIAALFPGYPNSGGAVGYFPIDTTLYANGLHTIAWVVVDRAGQARGIGSRYFTIANPQ